MNLQTFDVDFARQYGLECAVLFQAIGYWANHNRNKPDRQRDGKAWMYMSRREWLDEFGFIGEGTLRSSLQKLIAAGVVVTGNYSDGMYSRTTWYTLSDLGWKLWSKQPNPSAESAKAIGQNSQTITDTNSTTTHSTLPPTPKGEHPGFEEFWSAYPKKVSKPDALKAWNRHKPDLSAVLDGLRRWKASDQWTKDGGQYIPNPATWLNRENWKDQVAGEKRVLSADEIADVERRLAEKKRAHDEDMRKRTEAHRQSLGLTA